MKKIIYILLGLALAAVVAIGLAVLSGVGRELRQLAGAARALGDGLFQVETRRVERFVVCPECGAAGHSAGFCANDGIALRPRPILPQPFASLLPPQRPAPRS